VTAPAVAKTPPERLDRYLVRTGLAPSRRAAGELIAAGRVRINGRRCRKGDVVAGPDRVEIESGAGEVAPAALAIEPDPDRDLAVLYCDDAVLVVNKPGAVACHPLRAGERNTVMNAVVAQFPETADAGDNPREGGLVHRLDNGTSGALMIARTREASAAMRAAFRAGAVARRYLALVAGAMTAARDFDAAIAHHPKNPRRMIAGDATSARRSRAGRAALTRVEPVRRVGAYTLVAAMPRTGSRHQIRVHLARAGFPIVGDTLYGGPPADSLGPGRFWLHLERMEFDSPAGAHAKVSAPLPRDLVELLS
jgi:23S rRNA pseudouridine1911/1915/1917 synthase